MPLSSTGGLLFAPVRELIQWRSNAANPWRVDGVKIAAGGPNVELHELAASGMQLEILLEMTYAPPPTAGWNKSHP